MRIKRGLTKHRKHRKVVNAAKGYRLSYSKLFKRAHEARMHAGQYSFNGRKKRAGQFREVWITRINAALTKYSMKYSNFIKLLKVNKIELNRKMIAYLALDQEKVFAELVKTLNTK
jgi:large subunit ribosomal protein L20